jgi:hypothetical protein
MIDPDPVPRPGLFTTGDNDAWTEQVLFLRNVLRMPFWQIAAIDYGILPEHLEDEVIPFLEQRYRQMFAPLELFNVAAEIERIRRRAGAG